MIYNNYKKFINKINNIEFPSNNFKKTKYVFYIKKRRLQNIRV